MNKNIPEDKRLLEILDGIDDKYISEVAEDYKVLDIPGEYRPNKRRVYRAYAVALIRAACVLLLIGIVVAIPVMIERAGLIGPAVTPDDDLYKLNEADLEMLNEHWLKREKEKFAETIEEAEARAEYHGKYKGYIALFPQYGFTAMTHTIVGNYSIRCGHSPDIYLLKDSTTYSLLYAYEYGLIDDKDMDAFYEYHQARPELTGVFIDPVKVSDWLCQESVPIELTEGELKDIMHSVFKNLIENNNEENMATYYYIRCYGKFGGVYAVTIGVLNTFGGNEYTETVNGIEFKSPHPEALRIYFGGEIYTVTEASQKNILKQAELESLAAYFNSQVPLYPEKIPRVIYGDLEPDCIIVTLMPYTDISKYTAEDFADIGCTAMEQLPADEISDKRLLLTIPPSDLEAMNDMADRLMMRSDVYRVDGIEREYTICPTSVPHDISNVESIIRTYIDNNGPDYAEFYSVRCFGSYGEYDGAHAVFIDHSDQPNVPYSEVKYKEVKIYGYTFNIPEDEEMYIFAGGNLFTLQFAYDKRLISSVDLRQLHEYYEANKELYPRKLYEIPDLENGSFGSSLLITIMPYASSESYTAEDFSEIGCIALSEKQSASSDGKPSRIIELILSEKSEEAIWEAVKKLYERPDIYHVKATHYYTNNTAFFGEDTSYIPPDGE